MSVDWIRLPWALALSLLAPAVLAQTGRASGDGAPPVVEMRTLVVTATRYEERLESVPAGVTVITAADIAESTATDVPGILQQEVGLHVYEVTGNGRSYRVDRSGFGESAALNTLVLVDGRRLNNPDLAGADWALIPLDRVARIEIVRGSRGSVLFGDNAADGVINIITKQGGEDPRLAVEGAGGSQATRHASAYVSGTRNDLSYALSGRYYASDGYRENSATDQHDVGLNLGYVIGDTGEVGLSAGYHADDTGLPGALRQSELQAGVGRRDSTHPSDFANTEDAYLRLVPEIALLDHIRVKLPLSYRSRRQEFFSSFQGGDFTGDTQIDYLTASPQLVAQEPIGGVDNSLTLGVDLYHADEAIRNESRFFGAVDIGRFDLSKMNHGLYVHDELAATDRLALSAGYRWDRVRYTFAPTAPGTPDQADYAEELATAGLTYRFLDRSYVYLSFADGFRYPVLDEVFSFFTNTINGDLRPQASDDYEIGLRHHFTSDLYASLNLFRLDTRDEIFLNPLSFANENLDATTRREGVEVSAGLDLGGVSLEGTYTYRDTSIRGGAFSGNEVPNVPAHQASIAVVWRPLQGMSLALNGIYVGERYLEGDYANAFEKQDGYQVFNLKLRYSRRRCTLFLDLNNILDEEYAAYGVLGTFPVEPAFYPSPGFNWLAGLRYER